MGIGLLVVVLALGTAAHFAIGDSVSSESAPMPVQAATVAHSSPVTSSSAGPCTSGIYDHAVEVTIYGAPCSEWDRIEASSGEFWREITRREEPLVCSMSKGGPLIEVRDEGLEAIYGSRICAGLTAKGWSETPGPGVEREEEQRHEVAEAKAAQKAQEAAEERERPTREAEDRKRTECESLTSEGKAAHC